MQNTIYHPYVEICTVYPAEMPGNILHISVEGAYYSHGKMEGGRFRAFQKVRSVRFYDFNVDKDILVLALRVICPKIVQQALGPFKVSLEFKVQVAENEAGQIAEFIQTTYEKFHQKDLYLTDDD